MLGFTDTLSMVVRLGRHKWPIKIQSRAHTKRRWLRKHLSRVEIDLL